MGGRGRTQGAREILQGDRCCYLASATQMLTPSYFVCFIDTQCLRYSAFLLKCHLAVVNRERTAVQSLGSGLLCSVGFISAGLSHDNSALAKRNEKGLLFQVLLDVRKPE